MNPKSATQKRIPGAYLLVQVAFFGIAGLTDDVRFGIQYLIGLIALNVFVYLIFIRVRIPPGKPMRILLGVVLIISPAIVFLLLVWLNWR